MPMAPAQATELMRALLLGERQAAIQAATNVVGYARFLEVATAVARRQEKK